MVNEKEVTHGRRNGTGNIEMVEQNLWTHS